MTNSTNSINSNSAAILNKNGLSLDSIGSAMVSGLTAAEKKVTNLTDQMHANNQLITDGNAILNEVDTQGESLADEIAKYFSADGKPLIKITNDPKSLLYKMISLYNEYVFPPNSSQTNIIGGAGKINIPTTISYDQLMKIKEAIKTTVEALPPTSESYNEAVRAYDLDAGYFELFADREDSNASQAQQDDKWTAFQAEIANSSAIKNLSSNSLIQKLIDFYNDNKIGPKISLTDPLTPDKIQQIQDEIKTHIASLSYISQQTYLDLQKEINNYNLFVSTWSQILKIVGENMSMPLRSIG